jgi:hypothetical protein
MKHKYPLLAFVCFFLSVWSSDLYGQTKKQKLAKSQKIDKQKLTLAEKLERKNPLDSSLRFSISNLEKLSAKKVPSGESVYSEPMLVLLSKSQENDGMIQKTIGSVFGAQKGGLTANLIRRIGGEIVGIALNGPANLDLFRSGNMAELLRGAILLENPQSLFVQKDKYQNLVSLNPKELFGMLSVQNVNFLPGARGPESATEIINPSADNTVKE